MGNCYGSLVRRNNLMEITDRNGSGHKLMQLQEHGDGGLNRHRPILLPVERSPREGGRSSVQPFTRHNIENIPDLNLQRPVELDLRLQNKKRNSNRLIPSEGGEVRRIKVLISSRELSELLRRDNGDEDGNIESLILEKLQGNGIDGRHWKRSRESWRPSLSDIPEVISS
uniref:Uncharacterized protein n=1 Tax=Picea sitchensis TaxID=3332 RepID=A9P295_PICSI|nr:unknown [Picea sitchensis]